MNEQTLARLAGDTRAMGFMISLLIATHPRPHELRATFEQAVLEWIDQLAPHPSAADVPQFHEAIQAKLATYRELIERSVRDASS